MSADRDEKVRGLEPRYFVTKIDDLAGKHDGCRYFVLDPQHDPLARAALAAYAGLARADDRPQLADDLDRWLAELREDDLSMEQAREHVESRLAELNAERLKDYRSMPRVSDEDQLAIDRALGED